MTQQEIQERNEQIALMLGWKNLNDKSFPEYIDTVGNFYPLKELKFHSDWNWLMESCKFIEEQKIAVYIQSNHCIIQSIGTKENNFTPITYRDVYGTDKKEAVFISVSDFAKLYNEKKL